MKFDKMNGIQTQNSKIIKFKNEKNDKRTKTYISLNNH
jgi:hypothetical protein